MKTRLQRKVRAVFYQIFCRRLWHLSELVFEENSEVSVVFTEITAIKKVLTDSNYYARLENWEDRIAIFNSKQISQTEEKESVKAGSFSYAPFYYKSG